MGAPVGNCTPLCLQIQEYPAYADALAPAHACAGQAPYGYANSVCDAVCVDRRARGLPGLSMQWGPVANVGYVAETMKVGVHQPDVGRTLCWAP